MGVYIALLRGINVGGHKKIKMADLKTLCEELGFQAVQTYIQSGNVVFQSAETDPQMLEKRLQVGIQTRFGFEVAVLVRTSADWQAIVAGNPFADRDEKLIYLTFLAAPPTDEHLQKLTALQFEEEYQVQGRTIYLHCVNGYGQTQLSNAFWEKTLKVVATTRNWNTTLHLLKIASAT